MLSRRLGEKEDGNHHGKERAGGESPTDASAAMHILCKPQIPSQCFPTGWPALHSRLSHCIYALAVRPHWLARTALATQSLHGPSQCVLTGWHCTRDSVTAYMPSQCFLTGWPALHSRLSHCIYALAVRPHWPALHSRLMQSVHAQ
jgi:hypothetical protein